MDIRFFFSLPYRTLLCTVNTIGCGCGHGRGQSASITPDLFAHADRLQPGEKTSAPSISAIPEVLAKSQQAGDAMQKVESIGSM